MSAESCMVVSVDVEVPSILARDSLQCMIFSFSSTTIMRCASSCDCMYSTCRMCAVQQA